MNEQRKPKKSPGDFIHALTKSAISQIPIAGASAAEIFTLIVTPPYERRRDEWIESIGSGLKELTGKVEGFKIEELVDNEKFATTIMQASQAAIRNHQKEKLEALRNAVLNAALPNAPEEDLQLVFVNFIDSFTPWHLVILKFFNNPKEWGEKHGIKYPSFITGSSSTILELTFKELQGKRETYDLFAKDLYSRGLLATDSLHTTVSEAGMFAPMITTFGQEFLRFITSPFINDK